MTDPITIAKTYTYTITSDAKTTGEAAEEGDNITFTITRSDKGDETTVYLSTVSGTSNGADANDLKFYNKQGLSFGKEETTKTFVVQTYNDALNNEGSSNIENFDLKLYKQSTDRLQMFLTLLTS